MSSPPASADDFNSNALFLGPDRIAAGIDGPQLDVTDVDARLAYRCNHLAINDMVTAEQLQTALQWVPQLQPGANVFYHLAQPEEILSEDTLPLLSQLMRSIIAISPNWLDIILNDPHAGGSVVALTPANYVTLYKQLFAPLKQTVSSTTIRSTLLHLAVDYVFVSEFAAFATQLADTSVISLELHGGNHDIKRSFQTITAGYGTYKDRWFSTFCANIGLVRQLQTLWLCEFEYGLRLEGYNPLAYDEESDFTAEDGTTLINAISQLPNLRVFGVPYGAEVLMPAVCSWLTSPECQLQELHTRYRWTEDEARWDAFVQVITASQSVKFVMR